MLLNDDNLVLVITVHDPWRRRIHDDRPISSYARGRRRHRHALPCADLDRLPRAHPRPIPPTMRVRVRVVVVVVAPPRRAHVFQHRPLDDAHGHDARAEAQAAIEQEEQEEEASHGAEDDANHDARVRGGALRAVDGGDGDEAAAAAALAALARDEAPGIEGWHCVAYYIYLLSSQGGGEVEVRIV